MNPAWNRYPANEPDYEDDDAYEPDDSLAIRRTIRRTFGPMIPIWSGWARCSTSLRMIWRPTGAAW